MVTTTDVAIARVLQLLKNDITHLGIGNGVSPTGSSSSLDNELLRKTVVGEIIGNKLRISATWSENEGNGIVYKNTGCFCNGADDGINTGELFAGSGIEVSKDNSQSLTITIEIDVEAITDV